MSLILLVVHFSFNSFSSLRWSSEKEKIFKTVEHVGFATCSFSSISVSSGGVVSPDMQKGT